MLTRNSTDCLLNPYIFEGTGIGNGILKRKHYLFPTLVARPSSFGIFNRLSDSLSIHTGKPKQLTPCPIFTRVKRRVMDCPTGHD